MLFIDENLAADLDTKMFHQHRSDGIVLCFFVELFGSRQNDVSEYHQQVRSEEEVRAPDKARLQHLANRTHAQILVTAAQKLCGEHTAEPVECHRNSGFFCMRLAIYSISRRIANGFESRAHSPVKNFTMICRKHCLHKKRCVLYEQRGCGLREAFNPCCHHSCAQFPGTGRVRTRFFFWLQFACNELFNATRNRGQHPFQNTGVINYGDHNI